MGSGWQPIETAPKDGRAIWVALHGGEDRVQTVRWDRLKKRWDYINSHHGVPRYWQPFVEPDPPVGMAGPDCGCEACSERYGDYPDSRGPTAHG